MHEQIDNLADLTRVQARLRPERCALVFGERRTTYAELDLVTNRLAQALLDEGLLPGARVAWLAKDSDHTFAFALACAKARVVLLGINWRLAVSEIAFMLEDSEAQFFCVGREFADRIAPLAAKLPHMRKIVIVDGEHAAGPTLAAWSAKAATKDPALPVSADDVVVQMYTSGTTGRPKGVQLAHRSFFAVRAALRAANDPWIAWSERDVSLLDIPAFHIGGLWWAMTGLGVGACNVVMESFVGHELLTLIEKERVTKLCMVPAMIQVALLEPRIATTDLSSLNHVVYGGSPIPRSLLERAMAVFGCNFAQIYGLTETGNTAVCLRPADHRAITGDRLRAAGRPYPGVRLRCIDANGRELPPRAVGEICIRSPANMVGYWKRPDANATTLVDGWIHTGDAGYIDEEGYLFIQDRVKDMIIYAGENIYPAEIENVLCAHPAVLEAAVIGVPDERWGEQVRAFVVKRPGQNVTPRELLVHARRDLAEFKLPKVFEFVDSLPRTPSGKLKKAELREPFWRGRERNVN